MLEIENLTVEIDSQKVINNLSLSVSQNQAVGVIGPNGSGKTTLFNTISGFINSQQGKILYKDQNIIRLSADARAKLGLGRVFQNCGVFKNMTLEENMIVALEARLPFYYPLLPWSKSYEDLKQKAFDLLAEVNLERKFKDKASSLSGGQLRLLEIIRTLAFGAELLLLDEPTAGVSPRMKEEVVNLIKKLKNSGKTVLIIEHDINLIESFCDRVLLIDAGNIVLDDTPSQVRNSLVLQEVYFGKYQNCSKNI